MTNLADFAPLGTTPIPGGKPGGDPEYRYNNSSEWDLLKGEIDLLQGVSGQQPKWDKVQKYAQTILSQRAKDLQAATYATYAMLQTDAYAGLQAGLELIKSLLTTFWDGMLPAKPRAREGTLDWLGERASEYVDKMPTASESDRPALTAAIAAMDAINATMKEKGAAQMAKLSPSLHSKIEGIPAAAAPGQEPATSTSTDQQQAAPSRPAEIDSPDRAREEITKAAAFLRKANAADPLPYRLMRSMIWNDLVALDHTDGKTAISGGDAAVAQGWEDALKKKEYARVVDEAESRFATDRLWLDVHLYLVRAMEGLGPSYEAARRAIGDEVGVLVRRLPELPTLKFESGLPFASAATQTWIANELLPPPPSAAGPGKLDATLAEARKLASRKKLQEAMALMQKEMAGVAQGRERFLWRLALARVLVEGGKPQLAAPQLESLDKDVQRYSLEEWETSLTVEVVKLLWQCYSSLSSDKASAMYERLCRLDLTAAMALDSKK